VLRLIDQLNGSLYAVVSQEKVGRESYYTLNTTKNLPALNLNAEGLRQLFICRDFINHLLPPDSKKALDTTLAQASSLASDDGQLPLSIPAHTLLKGSIDYSGFQDIYQTMLEAILKKKVVTTTYRATLQDNPKIHDFVPMTVFHYQDTLRFSGWIVDGKNQSCYEKPTVMLLHRIQKAILTKRTSSKLRDPFEFEEGYFGLINDEPFDVTIRFSPDPTPFLNNL
jgi:predicted DNA-binding transcriptional regulator YafY